MRKVWLLAVLVVGVASGQDGEPSIDPGVMGWPAAARRHYRELVDRVGDDVASLWDLPGVWILVESLDPEMEAAGLTVKAIQDAVELRLRVNKVPVLTKDESAKHTAAPALYVRVSAWVEPQKFTGVVDIACEQLVDVKRPYPDEDLKELGVTWTCGMTVAATWDKGMVFGNKSRQDVLDLVAEMVDAFCLAFHKANAPPPEKERSVIDAAPLADPYAELTPQEKAEALLDPAKQMARAPDSFRVRFETTAGPFTVEVHRDWAPYGADRFFQLTRIGFFDDVAFFRVMPDFVVQFGLHGDPKVNTVWRPERFPDDPVKTSNRPGTLTFATSGPNSRTTQLFINLKPNPGLDGQGFSPFGEVVEGMENVLKISSAHRDKPDQRLIQTGGNVYLRQEFPKLDWITSAKVVR